MDPNTARQTMIEKANKALALGAQLEMATGADLAFEAGETMMELAEAVHDLDEWLRAGGFYPDAWVRSSIDQTHRKQDVDIHIPSDAPEWTI